MHRSLRRSVLAVVFALSLGAASQTINVTQLHQMRAYIKRTWRTLERSNATLLKSATDTKVGQSGRLALYIARDEDPKKIAAQLKRDMPAAALARIDLQRLPENPESIQKAGLLYLPHPYVVPGGRFNEMYGWDSYFIVLGLVRDSEVSLAKGMTDDMIYEIEYYGMILNANRTYYLTRSQPPFLTQMILEVFRRTGDVKWLASTLPAVEKYHELWMREPHFTLQTQLSRYDGGESTPAPEVVRGEKDANGKTEYGRVREYYRTHEVTAYDAAQYYDKATDRLTPLFYRADRAMRESGFDPSARFGPFSADILHYNPVGLNSLLYRMEMDTSAIYSVLDKPLQAREWARTAAKRAAKMNQLMWNEKAGLYFDYDFKTGKQSTYRFLTTFYPLWAGLASKEQAERLRANLPVFERAGGLMTSDKVTGNQWDAPFGWAPLQIMTVEGLRHYGFDEDADRISRKFLAMAIHDFEEHGGIKEKYDVVMAKSDLAAGLKFGYTSNEVGFGWTNAALVLFADQMAAGHQLQ